MPASRADRPPSGAGVVAGNVYDKYGTKNPLARLLVHGFLRVLQRFCRESQATEVVEVGCGEGHLLGLLAGPLGLRSAIGCDLSVPILRGAQRRRGGQFAFVAADICALPFADGSFDLVLACEVLEHLVSPRAAVAEVARVSRHEAILTVPREPLWRTLNVLRGSYLRDLGNTPGHIQHFSQRQIVELVGEHMDILDVASPIPWTAIRARVRRR